MNRERYRSREKRERRMANLALGKRAAKRGGSSSGSGGGDTAAVPATLFTEWRALRGTRNYIATVPRDLQRMIESHGVDTIRDGYVTTRTLFGTLHCETGPAYTYSAHGETVQKHYVAGQLHRAPGPAIIRTTPVSRTYFWRLRGAPGRCGNLPTIVTWSTWSPGLIYSDSSIFDVARATSVRAVWELAPRIIGISLTTEYIVHGKNCIEYDVETGAPRRQYTALPREYIVSEP